DPWAGLSHLTSRRRVAGNGRSNLEPPSRLGRRFEWLTSVAGPIGAGVTKSLPGQERRVPAGGNDTVRAVRRSLRAIGAIAEAVVAIAAGGNNSSLGRATIVDHVGSAGADRGRAFVARSEIAGCRSGEGGRGWGGLRRLANVCRAPRDRDNGSHDGGGQSDRDEK